MNRSSIDLWVGVFFAIGLVALLFCNEGGNLASFSPRRFTRYRQVC